MGSSLRSRQGDIIHYSDVLRTARVECGVVYEG
jgi:hypothetical protein